jgi:hypothetical protein
MANSEDYTVVWAGVCRELEEHEAAQAEAGSHSLVQGAESAGLQYWFDTFDTTPQGERVFHLLIGTKLGILGYKEGRSRLSLSKDALLARLDEVDQRLGQMGLSSRAELHILLRIEE